MSDGGTIVIGNVCITCDRSYWK